MSVRLALDVDDLRMMQRSIHVCAGKERIAERWRPFHGTGLVADADDFKCAESNEQ
jgi:hypothetical protein